MLTPTKPKLTRTTETKIKWT